MPSRNDEMMGNGGNWVLQPRNYARRIYRKRPPTEEIATSGQGLRGRGDSGGRAVARGGLTSTAAIPSQRQASLADAVEAKANGDLETFQRLMKEVNADNLKRPGWQIINLKDSFDAFDVLYGPIVAMHCICRYGARGEECGWLPGQESGSDRFKKVKQGNLNLKPYSCMGLGTGTLKWTRWPETYKGGVEFLTLPQAKEFVEYWDKKGYVHMIMNEGINTTSIGGFCNCDYPTCVGLRNRLNYGDLTLIKGRNIGVVDNSRCNGCAECIKRCQFGALNYEVARDKAYINAFKCFGCGLCQTGCRRDAIQMMPRERFPALANEW